MIKYRIQVLIEENTEHGKYCDALYFEPTEFKNLKEAQINQMKREKVEKWKDFIKNPPMVEEEEIMKE